MLTYTPVYAGDRIICYWRVSRDLNDPRHSVPLLGGIPICAERYVCED